MASGCKGLDVCKKKLAERTREMIFNISAGALCLKYDLDKPYAEQVKSNIQEIITILDTYFDKAFKR